MEHSDTSLNSALSDRVTIRVEAVSDWRQIEELLINSFGGREEAELVQRIRTSDEYLNELTLVAEVNNVIVGFVMQSHITLNDGCSSVKILSLAPLAVAPSVQRQGLGAKLMNAGIALAELREEPLIVLLGHAQYYPRFGFERASGYNIYPSAPWPDASYMVRTLPKFAPAIHGKTKYSPAWQID